MRQPVCQKRATRKLTTPAPYTITLLLITLSFIPLATGCIPQPGIHIEKQGPLYAAAGDALTYTYLVTNTENQQLSDVTVTDDTCGTATYVSGDHNHNKKLDKTEVWTFSCTTTPDFTFPSPLTNVATASGTWQDQTATDTAEYTLYPFILRKAVLLYWEGDSIDYADPDTQFTIQMIKDNKLLDTFTISETAPMNLWLSPGTYQFKEIDLPAGYLPAYDTITITTGETYPDFSALNIITFDLSVTKTGPLTCHPNDQIIYDYIVKNTGPASITPLLSDDLCGSPIYTGGDSDGDGLIDPSETWTYEATFQGKMLPGSTLINTATVTDAEGAARNTELWWLGGDTNHSNNIATWHVDVLPPPDEHTDTNNTETNETEGQQNTNESEEPSNNETGEPQETNQTDETTDTNRTEEPGDNETGEPQEETPQITILTIHESHHRWNIAPTARTNGPYNSQTNEELLFDASQSADPDGFIIAYHWDFGDGYTAEGKTTTHSYFKPGTYPVTLTVTDNFGASTTNTTTATITVPNRPPSNPFIGGPVNGTKDTDYLFIIGSTDDDQDELTYLINWGDGTTYKTGSYPSGLTFAVSHRWNTSGQHLITVTASDGALSATATKLITIQDTLIATNMAIIALAILAFLALIAILVLMKKKKSDN